MKRKLVLCIAMLCMLLLTACSMDYGMRFELPDLPESTQVYLMLKKEYAKELRAEESVLRDSPLKQQIYAYEDDEDDGYVCAEMHIAGISESLYQPQNAAPSLNWRMTNDIFLREACERYQTVKLLFYNEKEETIWKSSELNLIPSDKFGYPEKITYSLASDSFAVTNWVPRAVYGHSLSWWQFQMLKIGIIALAAGILGVGVIVVVCELNHKPMPWAVLWLIAAFTSVPMIASTVLTVLTSAVPYFKTNSEPFSTKDLAFPSLVGMPWILFLGVLLIVYLSNHKKTGKG